MALETQSHGKDATETTNITQSPSTKMPILDITRDLSALFSKQVKATPEAVALEDDKTTYTYAELDAAVEDLSQRLRQLGCVRDSLIGVLFSRSADYVIACLAALRAGGAFLVLELAYPAELLADVIEDSKPIAILTQKDQVSRVQGQIPVIALDEPSKQTNGTKTPSSDAQQEPLPAEDDLDKLAFVCYTSGTTGKPKGILNPHRAPVLSYDLRFRISDNQPGDRVACNAFFVWECLRPLLRGATVVAVPDAASYDPALLVELLASKRITETLMTPTLLATVLQRHSQIETKLPDLRTVWLNGEVVTTDLAKRAIKALPMTRLLNCYSASETHEIACGDIRDMLDENAPYCPVGPPMDPEHTYILDENKQELPAGTAGELYVGGGLLARGYLNLPEVTEKSFTPDPFDKTEGLRIYRTGDEARILPSGLLEITGRVGGMLKVRGYSVVPGKVESAVFKHLAVSHCAIVAHGNGLERQLVAYFVRDDEDPGDRVVPEVSEYGYCPVARKALSDVLPQYMIPALWAELPTLPTHGVSGKIDLKRLPPPKMAGKERKAPAVNGSDTDRDNITTEAIAELWADTLNISAAAVTEETGFFDLGGHSLSLATLSNKLLKKFGFTIPVGQLAGRPTLEGHLEVVRAARDGHSAKVQADLPAIMRADSTLPPEIFPSESEMTPLKQAKTILLTGATGFLGAFLLRDLLESTTAKILCLVRSSKPGPEDGSAGVAKLRQNLLDLGLWRDSIMDRVEILPGTLSSRRLGLSEDAFQAVAKRVQVIFHAGATVNLVYPYAALRSTNMGGTREILRLACISGATLQYISTNGVLPPSQDGWPEHSMMDVIDAPQKLIDGYGQTKWVAEQLVYEAGRRGLPVRVYRLGTLGGDSASGATNAYDLLNALIVESIRMGHSPKVNGWRAEITPVDFVSRAILTLAGNTVTRQKVFHLGDAKPTDFTEVFTQLGEIGYPTKQTPWDDWVAMWKGKRGSGRGGEGSFTIDILRTGMPTAAYLKDTIVLKDTVTKPYLEALNRPKVDGELLATYARHWYARGWLQQPPTPTSDIPTPTIKYERGALYGRVAVITGASSGIGAAVATALAREGAHVALAARRQEELERVKTKCKLATRSSGSKVITRKTDVTDTAQVKALLKAANDELGPVDILVSCAGVMYFTMMANAQTDEWDRTVDVNCKGLLHCLSATVPSMLARKTGHIVAISSDAGRKVFPGLGVYSASKFFVEATLQALRLETAGSGLRVTSVQPGNVATDLLGMSTDKEALKKYGEPSGAKVLDAEDVANSIVYALKQPPYVAVNEVLIEPRDEPI